MSDSEEKKYFDTGDDPALSGDPNLADEIATVESTSHPGKIATVAKKDGKLVCWVCFDVLGSQHAEFPMGETIIRVCPKIRCCNKVKDKNEKRRFQYLDKKH